MKKNWIIRLLALTAALLMLSFSAVAEETVAERPLGEYPERGITLPMTEEDVAAGISPAFTMVGHDYFPNLPLFYISYIDQERLAGLLAKYENADPNDENIIYQILMDMYSCNFTLYQILLLETDVLDEKLAAGETLDAMFGVEGITELTKNDGYTYVMFNTTAEYTYDTPELQERVLAAAARAKELLDGATYQPVVFGEGELTVSPDTFPAFETVDLAGNTVTNEIFSGKDLTVVNIWGTFCNPCIDEMPELAEWSASMPENVQLIGLVADLNSADDTDTLELAQAICEMTGANVYTSLIANEDFVELLSGVVGVPTTFFVDGNGAIVGDPIVGANVSACKKTVESLLSGM